PRGELILSRVLCEDLRSDFHSADQVRTRALILANVLQQHGVGHEGFIGPQSKRVCKRLRIIDGHLIFEMSKISSPQAFGKSQRFRLRMATYIEPTEVVETGRINYERVLFPMTYRVTQPARIQIADVLWKLPPIGVDNPMRTTRRFMQHHDHARG